MTAAVLEAKRWVTGSQNMIDRGYQRFRNRRRNLAWKDLMVRFEGPIVAGINALFVTD
jgi:cardiolipin synthase